MNGLMKMFSTVRGDALGGLMAGILSLPMTIPLGALALAPLGPDYISLGVLAGFHASIVSGFVAALAGGCKLQISGPRASVSLITAVAIETVLRQGADRHDAMIVGFIVVFLVGVLQVLFGIFRLGQIAKYIPYPVLSGFTNGVAILIILGQIASVAGLSATMRWTEIARHGAEISPGSIAVALATMAMMKFGSRITKRLPAIVLAFFIGIALDQLLRLILGQEALGPLVGNLHGSLPRPEAVAQAMSLSWPVPTLRWLGMLAPTIMVLALVGSTESLLSAAAIDQATHERHSSNRELIGQGLSNMIGACFGSVPSTGAPMRGITSYQAGARSRMAGAIHSLAMLALLVGGSRVLALLPFSVMGAIMIMIGVSMTDFYAFSLARRRGRAYLADACVVALVTLVTVFINIAFAVLCGAILALVLFASRISGSVNYQVIDRTQSRSLIQRTLKAEEILSREGRRIVVLNMTGPLFFGTVNRLRDTVESLEERQPLVVVLDLRNVTYIDISGAKALTQIGRTLKQKNRRLFLAGVAAGHWRQEFILSTRVDEVIPRGSLYPDVESAMAAAEDLICGSTGGGEPMEITLDEMEALNGLGPVDIDHLSRMLVRAAHEPGEVVFRNGENGDGIYLLAAGQIEITAPSENGSPPLRLATIAAGNVFGEMALLDGKPRSANAVAMTQSVTYFLSNTNFMALDGQRPAVAVNILLNMGRELSERLRYSNARMVSQF